MLLIPADHHNSIHGALLGVSHVTNPAFLLVQCRLYDESQANAKARHSLWESHWDVTCQRAMQSLPCTVAVDGAVLSNAERLLIQGACATCQHDARSFVTTQIGPMKLIISDVHVNTHWVSFYQPAKITISRQQLPGRLIFQLEGCPGLCHSGRGSCKHG